MELEHEADVLAAEAREFVAAQCQHVVAGYVECACIGAVECAHDLQQGGFARAAGADYADHLAGMNVEVDALEHFERAEGFVYVT